MITAILAEYRRRRAALIPYAIGGVPTKDDERVLIQRAAKACGVDASTVQAIVEKGLNA